MSRVLAITWDNDLLLLLVAKKQGANVLVEKSLTIPLRISGSESGNIRTDSSMYISAVTPDVVARELVKLNKDAPNNSAFVSAITSPLLHPLLQNRLKALIQHEKLAGLPTIVVLGRGSTEIRPMSFPPVPSEEIPDMARFQASKEFGGYEHNSPLDFILLEDEKDQKRRILASVIRPALLRDIERLTEEAGLNLKRVVLRPCEFATLWQSAMPKEAAETCLLIELDFREASLTILHRGKPVFVRAANLAESPYRVSNESGDKSIEAKDDFSGKLSSEIRRTIVAAQSELSGSPVKFIVLCGNAPHHKELAEQLSKELEKEVCVFDPWSNFQKLESLSNASERFAALLGGVATFLAGQPCPIDYLNPKRKPEKKGKQFAAILSASLIGLLIFTAIVFGYVRKQSIAASLEAETQKANKLKVAAEKADAIRKQSLAVGEWRNKSVNWLTELNWLSEQLPTAEQIILTTLTCSTDSRQMAFQALAKNATVFDPMEERLRADDHRVRAGNKAVDTSKPNYTMKVDMNVFLPKPSEIVD